MPAAAPTILATSGGLKIGARTRWEFAPLTELAVDLAQVPSDRQPRICYIPTAGGDSEFSIRCFYEAAQLAGYAPSHLALIPMPNVDDIREHILSQDVVWVGGGSVAVLLAVWRMHGLDEVLREAWEAGVVLTGVSAGSICWHLGGPTDSYGPTLRNSPPGLGLLPYSNGVHYDSEAQRRPLFHELIRSGALANGFATEDGVGLLFRGTELVEAVTEVAGKKAYSVIRDETGGVIETELPVRLLP